MSIPNYLTLFRIVLIPVLVLVFYLPVDWSAAVSASIFAVAALTDWLDGYLARRLQQTSAFGAFLDPVADKLIVAVALVLLVQKYPMVWMVLPAVLIIVREILISALREWMAGQGQQAKVAVSQLGKWKTTLQLLALTLLLAHTPALGDEWYWVGLGVLYGAMVLTVWSMWVYIWAALPVLLCRIE